MEIVFAAQSMNDSLHFTFWNPLSRNIKLCNIFQNASLIFSQENYMILMHLFCQLGVLIGSNDTVLPKQRFLTLDIFMFQISHRNIINIIIGEIYKYRQSICISMVPQSKIKKELPPLFPVCIVKHTPLSEKSIFPLNRCKKEKNNQIEFYIFVY